ncbi:glycosyltransferase family 2 protein [Paenibacillus lautus]|uniref:glycosyltransferase family 2 protein n=1 Tax=Paenibacillus lautus TaxID=1401 RepID=UPI003D2AED53
MKETEEWQAVLPLLQAGSQEQSQPPVVSCPPLVTIALCTYNDGSYLPWAVRSVLAQTFGGWELVILDDGSTDAETAHYLMRVPQDNRIKLIRQENNTGKSRALNRILNLAKAPWLLELDADDWLAPDALEILMREAGGQQNTAVVYANHMEWLERANKQLVYQGVKVAPSSLSPYVLLQNAPAVAPRMFNVSILKQVDGWDHHTLFEGRLYEDIGQLMKLSNTHKLYHVPEALVPTED